MKNLPRSTLQSATGQPTLLVIDMGRLKPSTRLTSYQSSPLASLRVHSATDAGGTPVPVLGSQSNPPLQPGSRVTVRSVSDFIGASEPFSPPVRQELGPGFDEKLQSRRPQIRPAFQLSGTVKVFELLGGAVQRAFRGVCGLGGAKRLLPSHPVATFGTALPTFRSVKTAGLKYGDESKDDMRGSKTYQTVKEQELRTVNCEGREGQVGSSAGQRAAYLSRGCRGCKRGKDDSEESGFRVEHESWS